MVTNDIFQSSKLCKITNAFFKYIDVVFVPGIEKKRLGKQLLNHCRIHQARNSSKPLKLRILVVPSTTEWAGSIVNFFVNIRYIS